MTRIRFKGFFSALSGHPSELVLMNVGIEAGVSMHVVHGCAPVRQSLFPATLYAGRPSRGIGVSACGW